MIKTKELSDPNSCLNKAEPDEMLFVLLGRDAATPATIRFWIKERVRLGKNVFLDNQLLEAEECAKMIEQKDRIRVHEENGMLFVQVWIVEDNQWETLGGKCKDADYANDVVETIKTFIKQEKL